MKLKNDIDSLIKALILIREKYPNEEIQISVNIMGDRVSALQSVCLDNDDTDLGIQLFFETTTDECAEVKPTFEYYEQGEEVVTLDKLNKCDIIKV